MSAYHSNVRFPPIADIAKRWLAGGMSEPWFRPNGLLKYRSLTWQGRAVSTATYLAMILSGAWGFFFTEPETTAWWASGALGLAFFIGGHAIILWKMDWGYDRR